MSEDYEIIDSTFEDSELPRGIERSIASAYIIESASKGTAREQLGMRNRVYDRGGRGSKPVGPLYEHNGKWRQKFIQWNYWRSEL